MELTEKDMDAMTAMMVVYLHAAERCVQVIENHYTNLQRKTDEYKRAVKLYGKGRVEQQLAKNVKECFRHDKKWNLSELLRLGKAFHYHMDKLTEVSVIKTVAADATDEEKAEAARHSMLMFDDQSKDVGNLMRVAAYMYNLPDEQDMLRLISTLKLWAKADTISPELINKIEEMAGR